MAPGVDVERVQQAREPPVGERPRVLAGERHVDEVARDPEHRRLPGLDVHAQQHHRVGAQQPAAGAGVGAHQQDVQAAVASPVGDGRRAGRRRQGRDQARRHARDRGRAGSPWAGGVGESSSSGPKLAAGIAQSPLAVGRRSSPWNTAVERVLGLHPQRGDGAVAEGRHERAPPAGRRSRSGRSVDPTSMPRSAGDEPGVEDRERVVGEPDQVQRDDRRRAPAGSSTRPSTRLRSAAQHGPDAEADEGRQDDEGRDGDEDAAAAGTGGVLAEAREQEGQGRRRRTASVCPCCVTSTFPHAPPSTDGPLMTRADRLRCATIQRRASVNGRVNAGGRERDGRESRTDRLEDKFPAPPPPSIPPEGRRAAGWSPNVGGPFDDHTVGPGRDRATGPQVMSRAWTNVTARRRSAGRGRLAGTLTAMAAGDPTRHLPLDGTRNVRDIGGYPAAGGRRTRWRTLLRSDELTSIPRHAQAELVALGLRQVIDLRWPDEADRSPNVFRRSGSVRYTEHPAARRRPDAARGPGRHVPPRVRRPRAAAGRGRSRPARARRAARDHRVCGRQGPHRGRHRPAPRPRWRADRGHRRGLRADRRLLLRARDRAWIRRTGGTSRWISTTSPSSWRRPSRISTVPTAAPARSCGARDCGTPRSIGSSTA